MIDSDNEYVDSFYDDIIAQLKADELDRCYSDHHLYHVVNRNHSGRGYFSWDGILDDMVEYLGFTEDRARDILRAC